MTRRRQTGALYCFPINGLVRDRMGHLFRGLSALCFALSFGVAAHATEPDFIGDFGSWSAFTYEAEGGKVCYIASKPTSQEGDYQRRGDVYTLVTHRTADGVRGEVSIVAGYDYKKGTGPTAKIGGGTFRMFAEGDTAWIDDEREDFMVETMKAGLEMVVTGTSSRDTLTTDTYSLSGFTKALEAIDQACPR